LPPKRSARQEIWQIPAIKRLVSRYAALTLTHRFRRALAPELPHQLADREPIGTVGFNLTSCSARMSSKDVGWPRIRACPGVDTEVWGMVIKSGMTGHEPPFSHKVGKEFGLILSILEPIELSEES
jgi:hypothetical protein